MARSGRHPFSRQLFLSYLVIVVIAVGVALGLTTGVLEDFMKSRTVETNGRLLAHFATTVDRLVLGGVSDLSLKVLQDTRTNPSIARYVNQPLEGHLVDVLKVYDYLLTTKSVSPLVYGAGIYFRRNRLIVSTELIRHTLFAPVREQPDFVYYLDVISTALDAAGNAQWSFDPEYYLNRYDLTAPTPMIHLVRSIYNATDEVASDGAVIISVRGDLLSDILAQNAPSDLERIFIVSGDGTIISHPDRERIGAKLPVDGDSGRILSGEAARSITLEIDGAQSIVTTRDSDVAPWIYVSITPLTRVRATSLHIRRITSFIAFVVMLLAVGVSVLTARRISSPLENLVTLCQSRIGVRPKGSEESNEPNELRYLEHAIVDLSEANHDYEMRFREHLPVLHLTLALDLVSGSIENDATALERLKLVEVDFRHGAYTVVVLFYRLFRFTRTSGTKPGLKEAELGKLAFRRSFEEYCRGCDYPVLFCERDGALVGIVNHPEHGATIERDLVGAAEIALRDVDSRNFVSRWCGIGDAARRPREIVSSYRSALLAAGAHFLEPSRPVFSGGNAPAGLPASTAPPGELREFVNHLRSFEHDGALERLDALVDVLVARREPYETIVGYLSETLSAYEQIIAALDIDPSSIIPFASEGNLREQLHRLGDIIEYREWMHALVDRLVSVREEATDRRYIRLIEQAKTFVRERVGSHQLSLELTADALRVSPSHLSRLFRQETGIRFVDFVSECRMELVRSLLVSTDLKIEEIADASGYSTSQYLIGKFRRSFGCTPMQFRRMSAASSGSPALPALPVTPRP